MSWPERFAVSRPGRCSARLRFPRLVFLAGILSLLGCALPGREYPVSPVIFGTIHGDAIADKAATLVLHVSHRESPDLHDEKRRSLARGAGSLARHFSFAPVRLEIAGHEYSKHYRVSLGLDIEGHERIIWRADLPRRASGQAIELDCDPGRPLRYGLPCRVRDPLRHAWLVEEGERTFQRRCARCHGKDARGHSVSRTESGKGAPNLRRIAERRGGRFDRVAVADWIDGRSIPLAHGTRSMPIWGERLSKEYERYGDVDAVVGATLDSLIVYLESLQETD